METFYKYQSLGNDFIIIDAYNKDKELLQEKISSPKWKKFVINSCKRHFGIGADGVLIISNGKSKTEIIPELLVYNTDGSTAEICLNGLRCAALHLIDFHDIGRTFKFKSGKKIVTGSINKNFITTKISGLLYSGIQKIKIDNQELTGHVVNAGNPHFIFQKKVTKEWLAANGNKIESHKNFKNKTNVEFISPNLKDKKDINRKNISDFDVLVYERGVGPTLSCSSGAAAICWYLYKNKKSEKTFNVIEETQKITLNFLGGQAICFVDKNKQVNVIASAKMVFKGKILK